MFDLLKKLFSGPDMNQIKQLIQSGAVVIDVRTPAEFSGGHFGGAKNIPLDRLESQLSTIRNMGKPVVLCCASGMRSARAKGILEQHGLKEVYDAGGWGNLQRL